MYCMLAMERIPKVPQCTTGWNSQAITYSAGVVVCGVRHIDKRARKSTYETGG